MYYDGQYFKMMFGIHGLSAYSEIPIYLILELVDKNVIPYIEKDNTIYFDKDIFDNWICQLKKRCPQSDD